MPQASFTGCSTRTTGNLSRLKQFVTTQYAHKEVHAMPTLPSSGNDSTKNGMQWHKTRLWLSVFGLIVGLMLNGSAAWGKEDEEKQVKITAVAVDTVVTLAMTKDLLTIEGTNFVPKGKHQ